MGCLNSGQGFKHWFGNIHLSGPCNRKCYFCIGQHMMALDSRNTLGQWQLPGMGDFIAECQAKDVGEVFLTGTNTDPGLYRWHALLVALLKRYGFKVGIRTNGIHPIPHGLYDKGSLTICSLDPVVNEKMMGGPPPTPKQIRDFQMAVPDAKVNIVLGPENCNMLFGTLQRLGVMGFHKINLREPYGQPRVGDPMARFMEPSSFVHGMPTYSVGDMRITYWDVHYCHVESVNLYANGKVSLDYPISRGHDDDGIVKDQSEFEHGRHQEQWL